MLRFSGCSSRLEKKTHSGGVRVSGKYTDRWHTRPGSRCEPVAVVTWPENWDRQGVRDASRVGGRKPEVMAKPFWTLLRIQWASRSPRMNPIPIGPISPSADYAAPPPHPTQVPTPTKPLHQSVTNETASGGTTGIDTLSQQFQIEFHFGHTSRLCFPGENQLSHRQRQNAWQVSLSHSIFVHPLLFTLESKSLEVMPPS